MRSLHLAPVALTLGLAAAPALLQAQREYTAPRSGTASTAGISTIRVANGSGRLIITGNPSATEVRATGTAHAASQRDLDGVKLVVERQGDEIVVHPDMNDSWNGCDCFMDLTVEVPTSIALEVADGSGGAELRNVGSARITSGSGGVTVQHTSGSVAIRSGSGRARVSDIHGDLRASSGSGGISANGVTGSVEIEHSGSGSVSLSNVSGSVHVGSIGSGSLDADGVGGDLTVDSKGSGSVHYASVRGKVSVPSRDWY
jgi:hypothetical protein